MKWCHLSIYILGLLFISIELLARSVKDFLIRCDGFESLIVYSEGFSKELVHLEYLEAAMIIYTRL